MSLMCAYHNCLCVKYPCSSIAFFRLPTDDRRSTWIKNSGNKSLIKISATAHRFFCENHFRQCDIRTQFNRKILRKNAVPIEHESCKVTSQSVGVPVKLSLGDVTKQNKNKDLKVKNEKGDLDFVIEKLDDEPATMKYVEVELPELESVPNDATTLEKFEDSYTIIDLYTAAEEGQQIIKEYNSGEENVEKVLDEIYYEETNSNEIDSSTIDVLPEPEQDSEADAEDHTEEFKEIPAKKRKINESQIAAASNKDYEEDKHFALSLVGYFQRLPKGQKSLAKLKILQYLTELEIGLPTNL